MKKIRIAGPPGTGKTTRLVEILYDNLSLRKYSPTEIMVISHTNTAADHIRNQIQSAEMILKYQDKTKRSIRSLILQSKETFKENVSTIHKFCKDRVKGKSFLMEDYENLILIWPMFNKYTSNITFYNVQHLFKNHPFFKFVSFARDNGKKLLDYYRELSFDERRDYKYSIEELLLLEKNYLSFKSDSKINQRTSKILDFQDMIDLFCENQEESERLCKRIKVLIVDEAQDSSVIQRKAELIMSKNVDYFYKAGDPDQSIFEFAGADPDSFHKEFANPEIELKQGYRCPRVINKYCKDIIKDVWDHYGYSREWRPLEDKQGNVIEGEIHELSNLEQDPLADELENKLINTKQDFVFTYRGNEPREMILYLMKVGIPVQIPKDQRNKIKFKYPTNEIKNHREFINLIKGNNVSLTKIKTILKSIRPEYLGHNKNLDDVTNSSYDLDWLIKHSFVLPGLKNVTDYQMINKLESLQMKNYIRKIVTNNRDLEDKRGFLENIHTIKGKEFSNVVLDLTLTRAEESFVKKRMKFVACSRSKEALWLIKSRTNLSL